MGLPCFFTSCERALSAFAPDSLLGDAGAANSLGGRSSRLGRRQAFSPHSMIKQHLPLGPGAGESHSLMAKPSSQVQPVKHKLEFLFISFLRVGLLMSFRSL